MKFRTLLIRGWVCSVFGTGCFNADMQWSGVNESAVPEVGGSSQSAAPSVTATKLTIQGQVRIIANGSTQCVPYVVKAVDDLNSPANVAYDVSVNLSGPAFYTGSGCVGATSSVVVNGATNASQNFFILVPANPTAFPIVFSAVDSLGLLQGALNHEVFVNGLAGAPDLTFDSTGEKIHAITSLSDVGRALAFQQDGKIVIAGSSSSGSNDDFAVTRYTRAGAIDTSFGINGVANADFGPSSAEVAYDVAMEDLSSKLYVAGLAWGSSKAGLVAMDADGAVPQKVSQPFPAGFTATAEKPVLIDLATQSVFLVGKTGSSIGARFAVAKYSFSWTQSTLNFAIDTSFGPNADGVASVDVFAGTDESAHAAAIQKDGKILLVGGKVGTGTEMGIARFNADGTLDTTFAAADANPGAAMLGVPDTLAKAVAVDDVNGSIVVAGYMVVSLQKDFLVAKYGPNGVVDSNFNGSGYVSGGDPSSSDIATSVAIDSDGSILVSGCTSCETTGSRFALARYGVNGTSMDWPYFAFSSMAHPYAMAIQRGDGRVVIVGAQGMTYKDFAIARLFP